MIIILWLAFSVVAGVLAHNKGRSGAGFFFLALLLSPIIGILAAAVVSPDATRAGDRAARSGRGRVCPHCAEVVKPAARVCRYCGNNLPAAAASAPVPAARARLGGVSWADLTGVQRMFLAFLLLGLCLMAAERFLL